jgi:hypothetical protein
MSSIFIGFSLATSLSLELIVSKGFFMGTEIDFILYLFFGGTGVQT